jgi:hypothetical protein
MVSSIESLVKGRFSLEEIASAGQKANVANKPQRQGPITEVARLMTADATSVSGSKAVDFDVTAAKQVNGSKAMDFDVRALALDLSLPHGLPHDTFSSQLWKPLGESDSIAPIEDVSLTGQWSKLPNDGSQSHLEAYPDIEVVRSEGPPPQPPTYGAGKVTGVLDHKPQSTPNSSASASSASSHQHMSHPQSHSEDYATKALSHETRAPPKPSEDFLRETSNMSMHFAAP